MDCLQLNTANDVNGNSRCLYVVISDGYVMDGEVAQSGQKPVRFKHFTPCMIRVQVKEWNAWKKLVEACLLENHKNPNRTIVSWKTK
jgi:hypothetical protein